MKFWMIILASICLFGCLRKNTTENHDDDGSTQSTVPDEERPILGDLVQFSLNDNSGIRVRLNDPVDNDSSIEEMQLEACIITEESNCQEDFQIVPSAVSRANEILVNGVMNSNSKGLSIRVSDKNGHVSTERRELFWSELDSSYGELTDASGLATSFCYQFTSAGDKRYFCAGGNLKGELGLGTRSTSENLVEVPRLAKYRSISIWPPSACGITNDQTVECWGGNENGELGNGSFDDSLDPVPVSGLNSVVQISKSDTHTCALKSNGEVWCWGRNNAGQLGDNSTTDSNIPVQVSGLPLSKEVEVRRSGTSCALTQADDLYCWGSDQNGVLGNGAAGSSLTPTLVLSSVKSFQIGFFHACAVRSDDSLSCWGASHYHQQGNGNTAIVDTPAPVAGMTSVDKIIVGNYSSCAIKTNSDVWCWGYNRSGQSGDFNDQRFVTVPKKLDFLQAIDGFGLNSTMAFKKIDGSIVKIGKAREYIDGVIDPVIADHYANFDSMDIGHLSACGIEKKQVKCKGTNSYGEIGSGDYKTVTGEPFDVVGVNDSKQIASGLSSTCSLSDSGSIRCWGLGTEGEMGNGAFASQTNPVSTGINDATQIAGMYKHYCAVTLSGTVKCWGFNSFGQVGNGTTTDQASPVTVPGLTNVNSVATGYYHSCAITNSKDLYCWGRGTNGTLGTGDENSAMSPVLVTNNVLSAALGSTASCIIKTDKNIYCFGSNADGQLGIGANIDETFIPTRVIDLTNIKQITLAPYNAWALDEDGKVYQWGANRNSQLGHLESDIKYRPGQVLNLENLKNISGKYYSVCGEAISGGFRCWGNNSFGILGADFATYRSKPYPLFLVQPQTP